MARPPPFDTNPPGPGEPRLRRDGRRLKQWPHDFAHPYKATRGRDLNHPPAPAQHGEPSRSGGHHLVSNDEANHRESYTEMMDLGVEPV